MDRTKDTENVPGAAIAWGRLCKKNEVIRMLTTLDPYSIFETVLRLRRRAQVESLRPFEISLQQWRLIQLARRRGAVSPSEAAEELDCDRPTATVIARNCLDRGWLEKRASESDGRSHRLGLTGAGEELLDAIERGRPTSVLPDPLATLDPEERQALEASLDKVAQALRPRQGAVRRRLPGSEGGGPGGRH